MLISIINWSRFYFLNIEHMATLRFIHSRNNRLQLVLISIVFMTLFSEICFAYGPFDYSLAENRRDKLPVVEEHHFNSDVETLKSGMTGTVWSDLNYTLGSFPNHHRALSSMARLFRRDKLPSGSKSPGDTIEYYFEKAINLYPQDPYIYIVRGIHYFKLNKIKDALTQFKKAEEFNGESAEFAYNIGLAYLRLGDNKNALKYAQKAYKFGYPLPGLRNKLKKLGVWKKDS